MTLSEAGSNWVYKLDNNFATQQPRRAVKMYRAQPVYDEHRTKVSLKELPT